LLQGFALSDHSLNENREAGQEGMRQLEKAEKEETGIDIEMIISFS